MTELVVLRGDITALAVDAIVNAANSSLMGGGGVDGAIHRAGGPAILEACREIVARQGGCAPGEAVITGAGELPARFVIHTVGPVWNGVDPAALDATLASCYAESLALAAANDVATVAFPSISTGAYGFPKDRSASIAVDAVRGWLSTNDNAIDTVTFVTFDDVNLRLYQDLLAI